MTTVFSESYLVHFVSLGLEYTPPADLEVGQAISQFLLFLIAQAEYWLDIDCGSWHQLA